jgi:hypothetical protein
MSGELKEKGWIINHKKVYRLMKEHKLLYGGRIRPEPFRRDLSALEHLQQNVPCNTCSMNILGMYTFMDEQECLPADGHGHLQPQGADPYMSAKHQK